MNYFDEIEKRHWEQYETDPDYRAEHKARCVESIALQKLRDEQESKTRNKAGRYTLNEAANFIADNSTADNESILTKLKQAANTGKLIFYAPNSSEAFKKHTAVLGWYEEVFWDDLNNWLRNNEPRLGCLFPQPETVGDDGAGSQAETVGDDEADKGRRGKQIGFICETAKKLGYSDLLNIPEGGKKKIKTECLKNTDLFTEDGFKKAWVEAGKRNSIRMQDKEKYLSNQ